MPDAPPGDLVDQAKALLALHTIGFHDPDNHRRPAGPFLQTALTAGAHHLLGGWL